MRIKLYEFGMWMSVAMLIGTAIGIWVAGTCFREALWQLFVTEVSFFWWWNLVRIEEYRTARRRH